MSVHPVEEVAALLTRADRVVVVPGYGLAVAQAQHPLRALVDVLTARGVEVVYAVHPVAGRVPGHLHFLLDTAQVPREQLVGPDEADRLLADADVALVVGADDVVNPAARTDPASPLHGLAALDVRAAHEVVVLTRPGGHGFAGVENELLSDPRTALLPGELAETLRSLLRAVAAG